MFSVPAEIYDLIYDRPSFKDYAAEAQVLRDWIHAGCPHARTLLDVACGTGLHAEHLSACFEVSGIDAEGRLLERARERNPRLDFHRADMETFDLRPQRFDVVTCLFSSVGYLRAPERLERTVANLARHLTPGGMVIVEPWFEPDAYKGGKLHMQVVDEQGIKVVRMSRGERRGNLSILDMRYLVGSRDGFHVYEETHEMGLFGKEDYLQAFERAGLQVTHDPLGLIGRGLFFGRSI